MTTPRLQAFDGFDDLTPEQRAKICNGAGAAGAWYNFLIPNTFYGLDCREAFDRHDYAYHVGKTPQQRTLADLQMLNNLLRLVDTAEGWHNRMLAPLRRRRALKYYEAVHYRGESAFNAGKGYAHKQTNKGQQ